MIKWMISLWTSSFVHQVVLDKYRVLVNIDFGGYMLFWTLTLIIVGIGLGALATALIIKMVNK